MRVGLNLLYAHPGIGGAWNYIASAIEALGRFGSEHEYFAYVHDSSRSIVPELPNFHIRPVRVNGERRMARVMAEHFLVPRLARQDRLDLLHWFGNVRGIFPSRIPCFVLRA